jgi:hypothetical protein
MSQVSTSPLIDMKASLDEYDVFVPLSDSAGRQHSRRLINGFRTAIVERFGGLTDFNHRSKGLWTIGSVTFKDSILLWRVLAISSVSNRRFFVTLKKQMQQQLKQKEILIIRRKVLVIR